jgi:3-mercaptopyruvate sulfurtransferase SseA
LAGICATINIIAMMALQVPATNVKLYDDSLSGWVRDPALPMVPLAKL